MTNTIKITITISNAATTINVNLVTILVTLISIFFFLILVTCVILYVLGIKYSALPLLKTLGKLLFITFNIKLILIFLVVFKVGFLTPLIITLISYLNIYIYINMGYTTYTTRSLVKQLITVFVISSLICLARYYLNRLNVDYYDIAFILDTLLAIFFIKDTIFLNGGLIFDNTSSNILLSSSSTSGNENNSTDDSTPTRGRSPERSGDNSTDRDATPTRNRSTENNAGYDSRSISPRSISRIINDSYSEARQGILNFFGSTFYIWDRPEVINPRRRLFAGAIEEVDTSASNGTNAPYKDSNGNTFVNPNGSTYTNGDELRSVINLRMLAVTPVERNNLERVISNTGGPIMFTQDANGTLVFFRLQQ